MLAIFRLPAVGSVTFSRIIRCRICRALSVSVSIFFTITLRSNHCIRVFPRTLIVSMSFASFCRLLKVISIASGLPLCIRRLPTRSISFIASEKGTCMENSPGSRKRRIHRTERTLSTRPIMVISGAYTENVMLTPPDTDCCKSA